MESARSVIRRRNITGTIPQVTTHIMELKIVAGVTGIQVIFVMVAVKTASNATAMTMVMNIVPANSVRAEEHS